MLPRSEGMPVSSDEAAELRRYFDGKFTSVDRRFDAVDKRFDAMDKQIGQVVELIQALATGTAARFDAIEQKLGGVDPLRLV